MEITDTFYDSLKIMGIGMTGIFVFMLFFGIIIYLLRKSFPFKEKPKTDDAVL
jgi:Oxaloacetate decarboxylase, gamma chain.